MVTAAYSSPEFEEAFTCRRDDFGAGWTKERTFFQLWAPTAEQVTLQLFASGEPEAEDLIIRRQLEKGQEGCWDLCLEGDWNGVYYTYLVSVDGITRESVDPYAITLGVNGQRGMILDPASTNPPHWEEDRDPHAFAPKEDAVIYEVHLRDISMARGSGISQKGSYSGLAEPNTHTRKGNATGLAHMKELGITHVQLQPIYDFGSVDENRRDSYNWGYDPMHFYAPEGSYASDPHRGEVRVREVKEMVKALHENGLSVIMDVVFNHVYKAEDFCFNKIVPGYFSRIDSRGHYSNGSGCGNDTATERTMVRKYIVDCIIHWMKEYHIDGFRFDLVGLMDVETISEVIQAVRAIHPGALLYGEGWDMGTGLTKDLPLATQGNAWMLPEFGFFNDNLRDSLRGSVFNAADPGFAAGAPWYRERLETCFRGQPGWAVNPGQSINYASCHDNHTLIDRISLSLPGAPREEIVSRSLLAASFSLLSQGIPFFLAGEELLRSKPGRKGKYLDNTYCAPDRVNAIKWSVKDTPEGQMCVNYYKGLLAIRKHFPCLRMASGHQIRETIFSLPSPGEQTLIFHAEPLVICFHAGAQSQEISLPKGKWDVIAMGTSAGLTTLFSAENTISIPAFSALVLCRLGSNC